MATIIINKTPVEYMNTEFDLFSLILLFDWSFDNAGVLSMKSQGNDLWFVLSGFWVWYGVCIGNRDWWGVCSGKRDWGGSGSPNDRYGVRWGVLIFDISIVGEFGGICSIVLIGVDNGISALQWIELKNCNWYVIVLVNELLFDVDTAV